MRSRTFFDICGQDNAKLALLLVLINPKAGPLLLVGDIGTGKSTLLQALRGLLPSHTYTKIPVYITPDMLWGSLDMEAAIKDGRCTYESGLLHRASGGIIALDDAGLMDEKSLHIILQAQQDGYIVEMGKTHKRRPFGASIIATMIKGEEGIGHPLRACFGMYAEVTTLTDIQLRCRVVANSLYDTLKGGEESAEFLDLQKRLKKAIQLLPKVRVSEAMLLLAAEYIKQAQCQGNLSEFYLIEATKALAAWEGRKYLLPQDMEIAATYVLPHRMRQAESPQEKTEEILSDEVDSHIQSQTEENMSMEEQDPSNQKDDKEAEGQTEKQQVSQSQLPEEGDESQPPEQSEDSSTQENELRESSIEHGEEQVHLPESPWKLPKMLVMDMPTQQFRQGEGKRSLTRTAERRGRYVRALPDTPQEALQDLALDATIRAAVPFFRIREHQNCMIPIENVDLRKKIREKRIGHAFLFVVDASGSMGVQNRMQAVKGAILGMLKEAYENRDYVGLIAFRKEEAEIILPFTRSVELAQKKMCVLPTGGRTPLAEGLHKAQWLIQQNKYVKQGIEPIIVLLTDGKANAANESIDITLEKAFQAAEHIAQAGIRSIVIDTEQGYLRMHLADKLAKQLHGTYYSLDTISKENIIRIVKQI